MPEFTAFDGRAVARRQAGIGREALRKLGFLRRFHQPELPLRGERAPGRFLSRRERWREAPERGRFAGARLIMERWTFRREQRLVREFNQLPLPFPQSV